MSKEHVADYISEMACQLSKLAQANGLELAAFCLCMASLDAARAVAGQHTEYRHH